MTSVSPEPLGSHKLGYLSDWNEKATSIQRLDDNNHAITNMASDSTNGGTGLGQISVSQRMLSATWGSILTSLLGRYLWCDGLSLP
jgi:hypothetical protein